MEFYVHSPLYSCLICRLGTRIASYLRLKQLKHKDWRVGKIIQGFVRGISYNIIVTRITNIYAVLEHARISPALIYDMIYNIYLMQLGFHPVVVVGSFVQK